MDDRSLDPSEWSNAKLMGAIADERAAERRTLESKGPIVARRFIEARVYPHLIPLLAERNRRMAARRSVPSE